MSFAKELTELYNTNKVERTENKEDIIERRNREITLFFEKEVSNCAKDRMTERAKSGKPTANILEYSPTERFYVEDDNIIRFDDNREIDRPNYRINNIVMKDPTFITLLDNFKTELSGDDAQINFSKWRPRDNLRVIEAVWGINKYHRKNGPRRNSN